MNTGRLTFQHPCYSNESSNYGRIHLPVAAKCNIKCNYCRPTIDPCFHGCKPGATLRVFTPHEALNWLNENLASCPSIKIVGFAGPGEPLYNQETFETLRLVNEDYPWLKLCLSTNGLLLPSNVDKLVDLNVETITVTINAINVSIAKKIYKHVGYKYDEIGVQTLVESQLEGVEMAAAKGICVKTNSVYIPGVNEQEIVEVSKEVSKRGAYIQNIMGLVPQDAFGNMIPPTRKQIALVRSNASMYMSQFTNCLRCRADAVIPGTTKNKTDQFN